MVLDILDELPVSAKTFLDFDLDVPGRILFVGHRLIVSLAFADKGLELFAVDGNKVANQHLLLVLVTSNKGDVFPHERVATEVSVDLTKLNAEAADLDLIVGATRTLHGAIRQISTKVTGTVHPVTDTKPELGFRLRLAVLGITQRVPPFYALSEPVGDKLLLGGFRVEVSLGEPTGSHVNFAALPDSTRNISVGSVDNQELDVNHTLSSRHDVLLTLKEGGVIVDAGNGKVGDGPLGFGRTVHVDDSDILSKVLQSVAVPLCQHITDEECVAETGYLASSLSG
jgi:hypothetical protein